MGGIGAPEIIIIAIVVMVLFGAKKMPDAARALGRSMRIFKSETKGLDHDDDAATAQHRDGDQQSEQQGNQQGNQQGEQQGTGAQPQQLSSAEQDQPAVDGKIVNRDQAHERR